MVNRMKLPNVTFAVVGLTALLTPGCSPQDDDDFPPAGAPAPGIDDREVSEAQEEMGNDFPPAGAPAPAIDEREVSGGIAQEEMSNVEARIDEASAELSAWKERWLDAEGDLIGTDVSRARTELEGISKGYKDTPAGKEAAELMALLPRATPPVRP